MRHLLRSVLLALAAPALLQAAPRATPAPEAAVALPATGGVSAKLRAGDVFEMKLTGVMIEVIQDIANLQYTIGPDGTVNIPLIGKIRASGLTATQLEDAIQAKYIADKIFTKPTVIINPQQGQRAVSISGGVRQPGRQPWTSDMTLGSAIGSAGDLDEFTSGKGIRIIREGQVFGSYNKKDIEKDPAKDPKLMPGDQVMVPK